MRTAPALNVCTKCATIRHTNTLPIVQSGNVFINLNVAFSYQILATPFITHYDATGLPTGLSVNHTTGVITGTITSGTIGDVINATISATNSKGTTSTTLTLSIKNGGTLTVDFSNVNSNDIAGYTIQDNVMISIDGGAYFFPSSPQTYHAFTNLKIKVTGTFPTGTGIGGGGNEADLGLALKFVPDTGSLGVKSSSSNVVNGTWTGSASNFLINAVAFGNPSSPSAIINDLQCNQDASPYSQSHTGDTMTMISTVTYYFPFVVSPSNNLSRTPFPASFSVEYSLDF